jgi:aspartyl-tRNA(Asn)/glutamyl-tRNA(Gln) amidotransferase subunit B
VRPPALAELIRITADGTISSTISKEVLEKMANSGRGAVEIVTAEGLAQTNDESALLGIIAQVIAANADAAAQYRAGQQKTFGFLVGQVMKGSKGKANPKLVNDLLKRELERA